MPKITSKYQLALPKKIADLYSIRPGDEIDWVASGDVIRVIPPGRRPAALDSSAQLRLFDQVTERRRNRSRQTHPADSADRGWTREDLYASRISQ